jgi:hypothetical protein
LARIIEDEAKHGYTVVFGSRDENAEKSVKLNEVFINRKMDGLIIAPAANTEDQLLKPKAKRNSVELTIAKLPITIRKNERVVLNTTLIEKITTRYFLIVFLKRLSRYEKSRLLFYSIAVSWLQFPTNERRTNAERIFQRQLWLRS